MPIVIVPSKITWPSVWSFSIYLILSTDAVLENAYQVPLKIQFIKMKPFCKLLFVFRFQSFHRVIKWQYLLSKDGPLHRKGTILHDEESWYLTIPSLALVVLHATHCSNKWDFIHHRNISKKSFPHMTWCIQYGIQTCILRTNAYKNYRTCSNQIKTDWSLTFVLLFNKI